MADLIGTLVAKNYQKISPSSLYGTRELQFVKVVADNGGDSNIDFTKQKFEITGETTGVFVGGYADADSYFSRAVRAMQSYVEVFYLGEPDETSFVVAISVDTANNGEGGTGLGEFGIIESLIIEALGIGNKAPSAFTGTAYNGDITVTEIHALGDAIQ